MDSMDGTVNNATVKTMSCLSNILMLPFGYMPYSKTAGSSGSSVFNI